MCTQPNYQYHVTIEQEILRLLYTSIWDPEYSTNASQYNSVRNQWGPSDSILALFAPKYWRTCATPHSCGFIHIFVAHLKSGCGFVKRGVA